MVNRTNQDILNLRCVSPQIEEYVCSEIYVSKYGQDQLKDADILLDCYEIAKEELEHLGIIFWDKENNVLTDLYTARCIYHFRKLFDSVNLIRLLKQNKEILPNLEMIVNSDENPESNIHLVLETLDNLFKDHPDIIRCLDNQERVISTDLFNRHINAIIASTRKVLEVTIGDNVIEITNYLKKINTGRINAEEAVKKILSTPDIKNLELDYGYIGNLVSNYDLDKTQPNVIVYYTNFDKENIEEIDLSLRVLAKKYMDIHHNNVSHHIEYWLHHPDKHMTREDIVLLVAHHYEPELSTNDFLKKITDMIYQGRKILTDDNIKYIKLFASNIVNHKN